MDLSRQQLAQSLRTFVRAILPVCAALTTCEVLLRIFQSCPEAVFDHSIERRVNQGEIRWSREGFGVSHWGPYGVRSHKTVSPGGVLVLGDSNTEGLGMDDGLDYPALLERRLGTPVYNAAFSGSNLSDYVNHAPNYLKVFKPSWVIIQTRDVGHELSRELQMGHLILEPQKASPKEAAVPVGIWRRTRLWQEGRRRRHEIWSRQRRLFTASVPSKELPTANLDARLENTCKSLASAFDNRLTVLYVSVYDPRHPESISEAERLFRKHCEEQNIEFISTSSVHQELARTNQAIRGFPNSAFNFGHVNALGHQYISRLLEPSLRRRLAR